MLHTEPFQLFKSIPCVISRGFTTKIVFLFFFSILRQFLNLMSSWFFQQSFQPAAASESSTHKKLHFYRFMKWFLPQWRMNKRAGIISFSCFIYRSTRSCGWSRRHCYSSLIWSRKYAYRFTKKCKNGIWYTVNVAKFSPLTKEWRSLWLSS